MCGIAGWVGEDLDLDQAKKMIGRLAHRGPDDEGYWHEGNAWLGQRRLAIVDLSSAGHQPMLSFSGRYVITYNGEIYNYIELMENLRSRGHRFRGHSDTEVLLAAFEEWGIEASLQKFNGMFAIAVWDREDKSLFLARDRVGEKPLYFSEKDGNIAFSSELTGLWELAWLNKTVDRDALSAYFRFLCVPSPASIVLGASKLAPGELLKWKDGKAKILSYWSVDDAIEKAIAKPITADFNAAADELEALLLDAVEIRLRSDVPYGALLSGGIDSSLIVALMGKKAVNPISTFTIGFREKSHDESIYADAIAKHLGTQHKQKILSAKDVIDFLPKVASHYDEPFADSSSVPTLLLTEFARQNVKVVLSGDGGDELFGGYPRYFWAERIEGVRRRVSPGGAFFLGQAMSRIPSGLLNNIDRFIFSGKYGGANGLAARVNRFASYLKHPPKDVYNSVVSAWQNPNDILLGAEGDGKKLGPNLDSYSKLPWAAGMMAVDQKNYLPDDILTKIDRASMAVGLEARAPILDHRLVEWSWRVPLKYKLSNTGDVGKLLMREVLSRYIPTELIDRPKMGFGMPVGQWLRSDLREWAESMLESRRLINVGLNSKNVRKVWSEHLSGSDRLSQIWTVLIWIQWQEKWNATL